MARPEPAVRGARGRDLVPGVAPLRAAVGVGVDVGPEALLGLGLAGEHRGVLEAREESGVALTRVLHAEEVPARDARVLRAPPREGLQLDLAAPQPREVARRRDVAQEAQVLERLLPLRSAGVAAHDRQVAVLRPRGAPREVVLGAVGLAVHLDAAEADGAVVT